MRFYPLMIREVRRETPDCVSIAFQVPAEWRDVFQFTQGQYLTLRTTLQGAEVRRSYSICTAPYEQDLRVAVKKVEGGVFSTFANESLREGDTLEVMPPQGRFFTPTDPTAERQYVAFASGSGITPVISILKTVLHEEPKSRFILFFGNRGFDHIIFREQLEHLKNQYPARLAVHHIFSRESMAYDLFQGHLNGDKCAAYGRAFFQPQAVDAYFLCGPEEMIFSVKSALENMGVEPGRIKFELFNSGSAPKSKPAATVPTQAIDASVTVIQDGATFDFRLPSDGSNLLDAAMRAGADLPYSCKGGVCSTCKAKVLEGEVTMEVNYGLEPDEIEAGFVLTCQAHPKTQRVVLSFDEV